MDSLSSITVFRVGRVSKKVRVFFPTRYRGCRRVQGFLQISYIFHFLENLEILLHPLHPAPHPLHPVLLFYQSIIFKTNRIMDILLLLLY